MKEEGVEFVAGHQPSIGLEPTDRALDDPPLAIAPQWATILSGRADATSAVRTDQFDVARGQALPQGITVGCSIIDQPPREVSRNGLIQQRLD